MLDPDVAECMKAIPMAILCMGPMTSRELSDYIDGVDWILVYAAARKLGAMGIIYKFGTTPETQRWHIPTAAGGRP